MFKTHELQPFVRLALLTLGLASLGLGSAQKTQILPGSPFAPPTTPRPANDPVKSMTVRQYAPTLNLLVTVRALHEVSRTARVTRIFTADEVTQISATLKALMTLERLTPAAALERQRALQSSMSAANWQRVQDARARLERNADMIMASSRVARDENLPSPAELRLSFLVPGGQAIVNQLKLDTAFNPFRQGVPATTLTRIVDFLKL